MNIFKKKLSRNVLISILVLSLIALSTSALIQYQESTNNSVIDGICKISGGSCQSVQESIYGQIFGIKLQVYGIIAFFILSGLIISEMIKHKEIQKKLIITGCLLAGISALALISIQAFILNQFCTYCLIVDTSSVILSGIILAR